MTKPNFERVRRPMAAGATSVIVSRRQKGIWRMKDCLQSANHLVNENDGSVCVYVFTPYLARGLSSPKSKVSFSLSPPNKVVR